MSARSYYHIYYLPVAIVITVPVAILKVVLRMWWQARPPIKMARVKVKPQL